MVVGHDDGGGVVIGGVAIGGLCEIGGGGWLELPISLMNYKREL